MEGDGRKRPAASLIEISRVLEETARLVRDHAWAAGESSVALAETDAEPGAADDPRWVRSLLDLRAVRRDFLGFEASDAALAMLLALYAARLEGRSLYQTALALAARVPESTALRITHHHLAQGTFERAGSDPDDRRLMLLSLSAPAAARLRAYLATAAAHSLPLA